MKNKLVLLIILLIITTISFIILWLYLSPVYEQTDDKKIEELVIEDKKLTPVKATEDKEEKKVGVEKKILPDEIIITTANFNYLDEKRGDELGDIIIYNLNYYFNESTELVLDRLRVERVFNDGERDRKKIIKWLKEIDMNNDNSKEFLIIFSNPFIHSIAGSTHYFIVVSKDEENFKYKIDFIDSVFFMPEYFVKDINNDKTVEIIIKSITPGIRVNNFVNIFQYNHQEEKWGNILKASMIHGDIKIVDKNNDNIYKVTLSGGGTGPAGMGMQRPKTKIYTYQQNKFTFTQVVKKEVDNIYFLMIDAYYALKENNLERVLELTAKALESPNMGIDYFIKEERCKPRILSYTAILAMIAYTKQSPSNIDRVNFLLEEIKQKYNYTDNPYINAAQVFRDTYINTKNVIYACQAMENEIIKAGEKAEFLWWYGSRTERIDIRNLCPFISIKD